MFEFILSIIYLVIAIVGVFIICGIGKNKKK